MSIAFIGVHRLINKMVNTCGKLSASGTPGESYSGQSHFLNPQIQVNPWQMGTSPFSSNLRPTFEPSFNLVTRVSTNPVTRAQAIPLKVMRLMEKQSSPLNAGRMVISGSFADVCAELDRLTERHSQQISARK